MEGHEFCSFRPRRNILLYGDCSWPSTDAHAANKGSTRMVSVDNYIQCISMSKPTKI